MAWKTMSSLKAFAYFVSLFILAGTELAAGECLCISTFMQGLGYVLPFQLMLFPPFIRRARDVQHSHRNCKNNDYHIVSMLILFCLKAEYVSTIRMNLVFR